MLKGTSNNIMTFLRAFIFYIIVFYFFILPPGRDGSEAYPVYATQNYSPGTGTMSDPYIIEDAEDLMTIAVQVNSGKSYAGRYFKLSSDIDLAGKEWIPIGQEPHSFRGNIDGNGKSVINMTLLESRKENGLFGTIIGGSVKNLSLRNVTMRNGYDSGGIAARICGTEIFRCAVEGVIEGKHHTGGIAGYASNCGEIKECAVSVDISSIHTWETDKRLRSYLDMLENQHTTENYLKQEFASCGGLIGYLSGEGDFSKCNVKSVISLSDVTHGIIYSLTRGGALVGEVSSLKLKVSQCDIQAKIFTFRLKRR
jgi:hypothetical protein